MNPPLQPDVHPDAESLNAFVEQALPQPERVWIVAHLGGCARCREVVFLARAAAEADAAPPAAVMTESREAKSGRTWWRANWRIALIPAAALASAVCLLIWVQIKPPSPAATVAHVTLPPPSPMPSSAAPPVPGPARTTAVSAAPPLAVQHVQPKAEGAFRRNSQSAGLIMNGPIPSEKTPEPVPPVASIRAPGEVADDRNLHSMARQSALQEAVIAPAVPPPPVPPNLVAVHGNLLAPPNAGPRPLAVEAAASREMEAMPQPVNGLAALRMTSHPRLPSGLTAVSSAAILDRILAVDSEGAVFLSHDATKHWERVPIQWTGKAVFVQAPPRALYPFNAKTRENETLHTSPIAAISLMPEPPAPAPAAPPPSDQFPAMAPAGSAPPATLPPPPADAKSAPAVPGMLFKLINDHHQTWISADGKVWHEQQGRK